MLAAGAFEASFAEAVFLSATAGFFSSVLAAAVFVPFFSVV